jgi:hypothetical protein
MNDNVEERAHAEAETSAAQGSTAGWLSQPTTDIDGLASS